MADPPKMPLPIRSHCVGTLRLQEQITELGKRYRLAVSPGQSVSKPQFTCKWVVRAICRDLHPCCGVQASQWRPVLVLHVHLLLFVHFTPSG